MTTTCHIRIFRCAAGIGYALYIRTGTGPVTVVPARRGRMDVAYAVRAGTAAAVARGIAPAAVTATFAGAPVAVPVG